MGDKAARVTSATGNVVKISLRCILDYQELPTHQLSLSGHNQGEVRDGFLEKGYCGPFAIPALGPLIQNK